MYYRNMPTSDVIVHIFVYFDNFYGISNNIAEETIICPHNKQNFIVEKLLSTTCKFK